MAGNFHIVKVKMAESEGNLEESEDKEIQRILDPDTRKTQQRQQKMLSKHFRTQSGMSKVLQIKKFKDIIAEGNIFPNPRRCGSINDKSSLRTMAGAISCD